jgi:hypothetical protein
MRAFLLSALGVPEEHILLLTDEAATRAAIIAGWQTHLCDRAAAGDLVFFHYSGHGSQSATDDPDEPDKLTESLVAYDSREEGSFDLLDKELKQLIWAVEARGAQVVLLMDCCHSGHITRTLDEQRPRARQCPPDQRARPPQSLLDATKITTPATGGASTSHILLAACRDEELANEYLAPDVRGWQGALTYFFLRACQTHSPATTWADVYDRLLAEVNAIYPNQSPQLEGDGQRLLFGGPGQWVGGYLVVLAVAAPDRVKVSGGAALGLTDGSRIALYPRESRFSGAPLGMATVERVAIDHAWATLDHAQPIEIGSRVKVTAAGYADQTASVAVAEPLVREAITTVREGQPSYFLRIADPAETTPDFAVIRQQEHLLIQDAAGEPLLGEHFPATGAGAAQVAHLLEHLTLYRNVARLRNLAANPALHGAVAIVDRTPQPEPGQLPVVQAGQRIAFRLHNRSRQPLYVTVLQLETNYAIRRIYPDRAFTERIAPGAKTPFISALARPVSAQSTGRLRFKVFVTTQATSFDALILPALNGGELQRAEPVRASAPLAWLLNAVRRSGTRPIRPLSESVDDQWIAEQLEFVVLPPTPVK